MFPAITKQVAKNRSPIQSMYVTPLYARASQDINTVSQQLACYLSHSFGRRRAGRAEENVI